MMINYGMDKMKFGQAVLAGQSIRMVASLHSLQNLRGVAKAEIKFTIEIKDQPKKALEGIAIFLYYFNWFFQIMSEGELGVFLSFLDKCFTQERLLCFDFFRHVYILWGKLGINKINDEIE